MDSRSFVVELIQLAATGSSSAEDINSDLFDKAVNLMNTNEISEFEDVTPFLSINGADASAVFGTQVTAETDDAFAAYLCYCI